ncbi:MAG: type II secretion system F family protein [Phycisphaerae bacterium]|nr:type II secretion system F family protein [Phycisphaerae bacterium]
MSELAPKRRTGGGSRTATLGTSQASGPMKVPNNHAWPNRGVALARALRRVAELLRSGLPLVEALRVTAPSCRGLSTGLAMALRRAARRIESGDDVSESLDAPAWFDAELRRLVAVGEAGGGLEPVLLRVAERHERQADRLVDRLSSLLEPAAILVLAALVGTVVMAAVLPLVKLQEVL